MTKRQEKKTRYTAVLKIIKVVETIEVDDYNDTVKNIGGIDTELAAFTVRSNTLPTLLTRAQLHLDKVEDLN